MEIENNPVMDGNEDYGTIRVQKALNCMKDVLGVCENYSNYIQSKLDAQLISNKTAIEDESSSSKGNAKLIRIIKELKYFEGGQLFPHQIEGVTWLATLFEHSINGILADEMGLGKTIQVIALISYLVQRGMKEQVLIIVPLATLPNWRNEFRKFAPQIPVEIFYESKENRKNQYYLLKKQHLLGKRTIFPVVITTYQTVLLEIPLLKTMAWQYVIVDEGHKIKNHRSKLFCALRSLESANRLLLTGTPLQNNITELWSLFNFLMPELFEDEESFSSLLMADDLKDSNTVIKREIDTNIISTIHKVIAPFILRRTKNDVGLNISKKKEILVYCPLLPIQREMYTHVLEKNVAKLLLGNTKEEIEIANDDSPRPKRACRRTSINYGDINNGIFDNSITTSKNDSPSVTNSTKNADYICALTMQNITMMLKKVVDHPYLINFPLDPVTRKLMINEDLINKSGKMKILEKLVASLKERGHKILIYSTLVMTLDLIEECLIMRNYNYRRLDGSTSLELRETRINDFNNDPNVFIFLISTRAGGLGLNLISADTVIFYDRDWNPQVDLQAQDRCHRIGQTRPVVIYTLVCKNTIDEKILTSGETKRRLEKLIIKDGQFRTLKGTAKKKIDLLELQELLKLVGHSEVVHTETEMSEEEWKRILDRSDISK